MKALTINRPVNWIGIGLYALLLLGIASATGRLAEGDYLWYGVVALANAAGIPIIDALAGPPEKPGSDADKDSS